MNWTSTPMPSFAMKNPEIQLSDQARAKPIAFSFAWAKKYCFTLKQSQAHQMLPPEIRLTAVTSADRNAIISKVSSAVTEECAWIDDVNFFSNIAVALRFVIPSSSGSTLVQLLSAQPLQLDSNGVRELNALTAHETREEIACSLQITFFHTEPDLRRHIPRVPGQMPAVSFFPQSIGAAIAIHAIGSSVSA